MENLREEFLNKIQEDLRKNWMTTKEAEINKELSKYQGDTLADSRTRFQIDKKGKQEARDKFNTYWNEPNTGLYHQLQQQYTVLYASISNKLLNRHPWLQTEQNDGQVLLKDVFIIKTLEPLMFELLLNKPSKLSTRVPPWENILIQLDKPLAWQELDLSSLDKQIAGFPLSREASYADHPFPTYLDAPFTTAPMRCDLYRLLQKNYPAAFQSVTLSNQIACRAITALHHSELRLLSVEEWNHFTSLIVNIGEESNPKWVILDKKNSKWTLYLSDAVAAGCQEIDFITKHTVENLQHANIAISRLDTWHAVLLSRVLPWCQSLVGSRSPDLSSYRATIPSSLLAEHALEASCLAPQKKAEYASQMAFAKSRPFSELETNVIYLAKLQSSDFVTSCLLPDIPETAARLIIDAFDKKTISYDPNHDCLTIADSEQYKEAMKLAYHHSIKTLRLQSEPPADLEQWFAYNLTVTTIESPERPAYAYMHACAARNRFLEKKQSSPAAQEAWKTTGALLYALFNNSVSPDTSASQDIAAMGKPGLDCFFSHLEQISKPALSCTFDLDSGHTLPVDEYISYLADKISSVEQKPLLRELNLILPKTLSTKSADALVKLLQIVNARGEIKAVSMHGLQATHLAAIKKLQTLANHSDFYLQVKIPEWDNHVATTSDSRSKAAYRALQNQILSNIRLAQVPRLQANTRTIATPLPVIPLKTKTATEAEQSWTAGNAYSFLSTVSTGVQQQAQQEVAQQMQQEMAQQSPVEVAKTREIKTFTGSEDDLITRNNFPIQENLSVKDFSSWVGSEQDAPAVIQKMDKAAFEKIQEYGALFQFGIDWENTPGFRLYVSPQADHALILTYDHNLASTDQATQKPSAFAIQMQHHKAATAYDGDYRQFEALVSSDSQQQMTAWHHLANETVPAAIQAWLQNNQLATQSTESMQHFDNTGKIESANNSTALLLNTLKQWANTHINTPAEKFLSLLFTENAKTVANMQAFGQLFYHYGIQGNVAWLQLAYQVYTKSPEKLALYKQYFLDPVADWSECLDKEEVEALTSALEKLNAHQDHQDILWSLLAAHGDTLAANPTIRMRFSEIWHAYNKIIDYCDANDLTINKQEMLHAIQAYPGQFNASQFLRRLYGVLQYTGNRQDSPTIQQEIFSNLSQIDWHENGFYYACVHEQYRYWDAALQLSKLQRLDQAAEAPGYTVRWDVDLRLVDPVGYSLRYAAQRLQLNKADFNCFKTILTKADQAVPTCPALLRLITASLAVGVDTVASLAAIDWTQFSTQNQNFFQQINEKIVLDAKKFVRGSYQVPLAQLPLLLSEPTSLTADLNSLNSLGRALQCYQGNRQKFAQLIDYAKTAGFDSPNVTTYPWLVDTPLVNLPTNPEIERFYQQLRSIDFAKTTHYPDNQTLNTQITRIHSAMDRQNAVTALLKSGCFIKDQDTDFRELTEDEKKLAENTYLSKTFRKQNSLLIKKFFNCLTLKEEGNSSEKIQELLNFFSDLDRKNYYDELGQLLGMLLEKSAGKYYSLEQLSIWLHTVFDKKAFATKPYPVTYLKILLTDASQDSNSSLLNTDFRKFRTHEPALVALQTIMAHINLADLSDQAKKTLVKCAIQYKAEQDLPALFSGCETIFRKVQSSPQVTAALSGFIASILKNLQPLQQHIAMLTRLTAPYPGFDDAFTKLWESGQVQLLKNLTHTIDYADAITQIVSITDPHVRMVMTESFQASAQLEDMANLSQTLLSWSTEDRSALAKYYLSEPKPSLTQLKILFAYSGPLSAKLAYFESVIQAAEKRNYSLSPEDAHNVCRVLHGIRLKNQTAGIPEGAQAELLRLLYYSNTFSHTAQLARKDHQELLDLIHVNKQTPTTEATARVLACMREICLRKTGKWINHTQMINLLYSSLHNTDNIIHQVRTGEGKSLLSVMSVVYGALHGEIIDIFSSKESLSLRDYEEFSSLLDAFGIPNTHLTANSAPERYHNTRTAQGVGAVHYATIGNWSLFLSGVCWEGKDTEHPLDMRAAKRVAYLDEADHILRSENTLFNFSEPSESDSVYNYDAWIYAEVYDFYTQHQIELEKNGCQLYEVPHLQILYRQLQEASIAIAPDKSSFFKKYLATGDNALRNQILVDLVKAAHSAHHLQENVDFCVMDDHKQISTAVSIDTRFAKVMINNQVYHGSTFSDSVQQFLHVRLNKEAIQKGQMPNFLVESIHAIVLSLHARYIIKNYYTRKVGFTGTPGDKEALNFYAQEFGIDAVIKMPTHQDIITIFLPPIYSTDEATQVAEIAAAINENPLQPILITCEDDKAVEHLHTLLQSNVSRSILKDTNAQGFSEADILQSAGQPGAITISARLGRGTNITPANRTLGLKVLRTYPAIPEIVKQEQGRQGRNGDGGVFQEIINYAHITEQCAALVDNQDFQNIVALEKTHLTLKLQKPRSTDKQIWAAMREDPALQEQYVNTRSLQRFKHQQKEAELRHTRQKDDLIAEGSGQVMAYLPQLSAEGKARLKAAWKTCKKTLETSWSMYQDCEKLKIILNDFYTNNGEIIQAPRAGNAAPHLSKSSPTWPQKTAPISDLIALYQAWLGTYITDTDAGQYDDNLADLDALYLACQALDREQVITLTAIVQQYPSYIHAISSSTWSTAIIMIQRDVDIMENYATRLHEFFTQSPPKPQDETAFAAYNRAFIAAIEGVPNTMFLKTIIQDNFTEYQYLLAIVDTFPKQVIDLCKNHMHEEDILYFLSNMQSHQNVSPSCIAYLRTHCQAIKDCPAMLTPCIALLFQGNDMNLFEEMPYSEQNSLLLDFLSRRPPCNAQSFGALQAKITRIAEPYREIFVEHLSKLPPYISLATVLQDLKDLPGKNFKLSQHTLDQRIKRMQSATEAFIAVMFGHDLISSKDSFAKPSNSDYQAWDKLFSQLPLEQREECFTAMQNCQSIPAAKLLEIAQAYLVNKKSQDLHATLQALKEPQPVAIESSREQKSNSSGMSFFQR